MTNGPFQPGTLRHQVGAILYRDGTTPFDSLCYKVRTASGTPHALGEVRGALMVLKRGGNAQLTADGWRLTAQGMLAWEPNHYGPITLPEQPKPSELAPRIVYSDQDLVRGIARRSSPADNIPFQPRTGSMDFAGLPRVCGSYRIWPDGRRERIDGKPDAEAA